MTDAPASAPQRKVPCRVFTPAGWILGTFHVPLAEAFATYLDRSKFFTLTNVQLPRQGRPLPFLALQRSATVLVIPGEADAVAAPPAEDVAHQVSCLFEGGVAMGALHLPQRTRVSDHLIGASRFFVIRSCTVGIDGEGGPGSVAAVRAALVNAQRVVGVAEM